VAVGSQWDSLMFRFFKFDDKSLHWGRHEMPVVNEKGEGIDQTAGVIVNEEIHVYHYGAMKKEERILEKLKYYSARDKGLKVKNTWSTWKQGDATQWTHGGGTVKKFSGTHPPELKGLL